MGLGVAHRSSGAQAGASITGARRQAHEARELLQQGVDPIAAREGRHSESAEFTTAKLGTTME
jgi:hypothetical protein